MTAIRWAGLAAALAIAGAIALLAGIATEAPHPADDPTLARGRQVAAACAVCHAVRRGDTPRVAPPLWNIVGAPKGAAEGFGYSPALRQAGGVWDEPSLDAFLHNPQAYLPGTTMTFHGLPDAADRADVIAYLRSRPQ